MSAGGFGVAIGDYDNDGWPDIYVSNFGKNRLYHNNHDGTFTDVAEAAGVTLGNWSTGATFGDYDGDGRLDLFVPGYIHWDMNHLPPAPGSSRDSVAFCQFRGVSVACGPRGLPGEPDHLFHNNGDGTFTDVSESAGVADKARHYGFTAVFDDVNNDGKVDLLVANDSTANYLYINKGNGKFEDASIFSGFALNRDGLETASMGMAVGDYRNDGNVDLYTGTFSDDYKPLYHNDGDANFTEISPEMGMAEITYPFLTWAVEFFDYDNDGWKDLLAVNGHVYPQADTNPWGTSFAQRPYLFHNTLKGAKFEMVPAVEGTGLAAVIPGRGAAFGDLFNDGKIDVVINCLDKPPVLLRNVNPDKHHWIELQLTGGPKSPRDAVGSVVYVTSGGLRQRADVMSGGSYESSNDQRLHFGIGDATTIYKVEVHWPSGSVERIALAGGVDRIYEVAEGKGVVPSVYDGMVPKKNGDQSSGGFAQMISKFTARQAGLAVLVFLSSFASSGTGSAQSAAEKDRKDYSDKVRQTYNFRFGNDKLTTPGNISAEGGDFIQPGAFPNAEYCQHCHPQAYQEWRQALHSNSFRTPFYRTSVNILARSKGIEFTRHCDSCHNPVGVLSGALTQDSTVDRSFDQDGLTCATCHSIQKVKSTEGNGGFVMAIPSVLVDEKGNRIPGKVPYEDIMNHPERHSRAMMKDFYHTPELCAACHKANLPDPLNDYKFVRAFSVYDEWQNSKFSLRNPLVFYPAAFTTCHDCHMAREASLPGEYGAKKGTFAAHRWVAGNTAVPFYYGFSEQLDKTIEFLKSGMYLNVDLFAIKKKAGDIIAPLGSKPFTLAPQDVVEAMVVIQNKNIGHSLVPEVRDLYETWVEFMVKDRDGKELYHSGFLKPDGTLEPGAHSFTNRPINTEGEFVDNHKVWTIHSVAYDHTIPAGRSELVRYQFRVPAAARGPFSVTARVNYRHFRQSYLNNVFGEDHPAYPVVELSARTRVMNVGENTTEAPETRDNPDWMRWNNFGIALLDQTRYEDAVNAFSNVVALRPDYSDGYVNIGLTDIAWEKYESARSSLEEALKLKPDSARALFYMSLVARRQGRSAEELADLQKVVAQYPESRDARRELGATLFQQHRQREAMEQFEALQKIDPDDVAAHYNLAISL